MFNRKILLVVSAVYVVFSVLAYASYETEREEIMLGLPPEARPYVGAVEILPFSAQLGVILADGILLGVCWILTQKQNKKAIIKTREIYHLTNSQIRNQAATA